MALVLNDRVKETTTSTGTGTINLAGAETGFETFVAGVGNSNTCYYCIAHQSANEFEVGLGTVTDATPDTLARTTIISSSNSDSAVDFSAGTKDVFCTLPASKAVFLNGSGDINLADNSKILLGAGDDLRIYHDGNNSIISDEGTGGLFLRGTDTVDIQSALGHNYLKSTISAGTQIYYDNAEKFATVSGGIKVTGGIENASGNMRIDVAGVLFLDGDTRIDLEDGGSTYGRFQMNSTSSKDFIIQSIQDDKDMLFKGSDGGSTITALTLDMSDAGAAIFNNSVRIGQSSAANLLVANNSNVVELKAGKDGTDAVDLGFYTQASGGTLAERMRLDSGGNLVASGNITAYGSPSDIKLKENIEVIDNALDKVKQLKGITYDLKSDGNRLTGLIAQDLEKVLPEAVYTAKDLEDEEHLAIRYGNTVGLLVEAIKEQQEQIETLTAKVKELENK